MNPYEVLGIEKTASQEEIRKAYKKLAKKYHPDVSEETGAVEKFKEVAEAYELLDNPEKRRQYDTFGSTGSRHRDNYSFFGDMDSVFNEFFNQGRQKRVVRGDNIQVVVSCTLEDVMTGCAKDVEYMQKEICDECNGAGAKTKKTCDECNGKGASVRTNGNMAVHTTCVYCRGTGEVVEESCAKCGGVGLTGKRHKTVGIKIPAGIEDGMRLTFRGGGEPAITDGVPGNLYIFLEITEHEFFERGPNGDLYCKVPVSYTQLILGDKIKFATLNNDIGDFIIPAGTQPETKFKLAGEGLPIRGLSKRGDIVIALYIDVPEELDKDYQEIISKLAEKEAAHITARRKVYEQYLATKA